MLTKFRKPSKSLLFSVNLLKIIFFYKKEKENEENKNDLNFRIVDERDENIKRLNIKRFENINCRHFFLKGRTLYTQDSDFDKIHKFKCKIVIKQLLERK